MTPFTCRFTAGFVILALTACATPTPQELASRADRLAQRSLIVDTHIDVPYRIQRRPVDVGQATPDGEFDYPRAVAGGLNAPFMSIYTPAREEDNGNAYAFAQSSLDVVTRLAEQHPDKFAIATCARDLIKQQRSGLISLPLGMENGGPIDNKISNLQHFFDRGIRYITLAHSKSNHISDSSYDDHVRWQGLSPFGQTLITEMNRLGIMIDVSHISDDAFWQVLELSAVPVIASHSSLRHFTPDFHRNMSDAMVQALGEAGGVVQINFGSSFIHQAAREWSNQRTANVQAYAEEHGYEVGDEEITRYLDAYREAHPYPYADLDHVLDHIDRAVSLAGIDGVGIGSDYDGVGNTLPNGLKDDLSGEDTIILPAVGRNGRQAQGLPLLVPFEAAP